jgi:hypothetical protein
MDSRCNLHVRVPLSSVPTLATRGRSSETSVLTLTGKKRVDWRPNDHRREDVSETKPSFRSYINGRFSQCESAVLQT